MDSRSTVIRPNVVPKSRIDEIFEFLRSRSIKFGRYSPNLPNEDSVVLTSTFNLVTPDKLSVLAMACSLASLNDSCTWWTLVLDLDATLGDGFACSAWATVRSRLIRAVPGRARLADPGRRDAVVGLLGLLGSNGPPPSGMLFAAK